MILRVLILTPTTFPSITGNAVTAERWRRSLEERGIAVKIVASQNLDSKNLSQEIRDFSPDIIHGHHAYKTGKLLLSHHNMSSSNGIPYVISCAGTDINHDLTLHERKEIILETCRMARATISQSEDIASRLKDQSNGFHYNVFYVPKSFVWLGNASFDIRKTADCEPRDILFFMPAGIRPVKGNVECLTAINEVHKLRPSIKALFAGPVIDNQYASQFMQILKQCSSFARWLPAVPPEAMRSAYRGADVVINASFSEGFSNVLLEAMASGKPILASDIRSNRRAIIGDNGDSKGGCFFDLNNQMDFIHQALRLIDDAGLRISLGQTVLIRAEQWIKPGDEAEILIKIYKQALSL